MDLKTIERKTVENIHLKTSDTSSLFDVNARIIACNSVVLFPIEEPLYEEVKFRNEIKVY